MKIKLPLAIHRFVVRSSLLVALTGCAGAGGGSALTQSSGTPVNPRTNPGGADTATAALTGAQPRRY